MQGTVTVALPPSTTMLFTIACYFPGDKPHFIPVEIHSEAWVEQLVNAIEAKLHRKGVQVELDDLRLYKVNLFLSESSQLTHTPD